MQKFNFALLFCIFYSLAVSQSINIDSLKIAYKTAKTDTIKCKILLSIIENSNYNERDLYTEELKNIAEKNLTATYSKSEINLYKKCSVIYYGILGLKASEKQDYVSVYNNYNKSLQLSEEIKDTIGIMDFQNRLALNYKITGNISQALKFLYKVLKQGEYRKDTMNIIFPLSEIALIYYEQKDYSNALKTYNRLLYVSELSKDDWAIGFSLSRLVKVSCAMKNKPLALSYFNKCIKNHKENESEMYLPLIYEEIARLYKDEGDTDKGLEFMYKSLAIRKKQNDSTTTAATLNNLGVFYQEINNSSKALECLNESLKIKLKLKDKQSIVATLNHIGDVYFSQKNYPLAIKAGEEALKLSEELGVPIDIKNSSELLFKCYTFFNQPVLALNMHHKFLKMRDSLNSQDILKTVLKNQFDLETEKSEAELKAKEEARKIITFEEKKRQTIIVSSIIGILLIVIVFSGFLYKRFKVTQKQKGIIESQKHLVEEKQKEIIESITYAKRLQEAILPPQEFIDKYIPNNFILYKPKDLVAGDFYWAEKINDLFLIAAADSTGHGVPGAMVSVVCSNALNRSVKEFHLTETGKILDKTRELVLETFEKSTSEVKDGMDISLLCIDSKNKQVFWSGANNPLWYFQDNELKEIKADKQPIGKTEYPKPFTTHQIEYKENTTFYLFTDGFADQFGGEKGKKFKYKQFSDLLVKNINQTQQKQAETINKAFEDWKGNLEQVDDVCVIGIKI